MKKGFTLIEIMIVVVIAVSVAAFAVPAYKKSMDRNKFMAAEGKLIELSTALRNVQQMFGGYACPAVTNMADTYLNADGTLNAQGCQAFPQECLFRNHYTNANLNTMHTYRYTIKENCSVCMNSIAARLAGSRPYNVCIDNMGTETLKYRDRKDPITR